ncbi:MAG: SDR family oxidoreductase [Actinomycetota bacterium]
MLLKWLPIKGACNAIAPGHIETSLTGWMPEEHRPRLIPRIPLRRFGTVEEMAGADAFPIEDATRTTGQTLVIDGGILVD